MKINFTMMLVNDTLKNKKKTMMENF